MLGEDQGIPASPFFSPQSRSSQWPLPSRYGHRYCANVGNGGYFRVQLTNNFGFLTDGIGSGYSKNHLYSGLSHPKFGANESL